MNLAVPCGPINTVADVFADEQVRARGLKIEMQHPQAGAVPLVASPIRLSDTAVQFRSGPPQLGQHTGAARPTGTFTKMQLMNYASKECWDEYA